MKYRIIATVTFHKKQYTVVCLSIDMNGDNLWMYFDDEVTFIKGAKLQGATVTECNYEHVPAELHKYCRLDFHPELLSK